MATKLAEAFGLPYVQPYFALTQGSEVYRGAGINFAVAGATALDQELFRKAEIMSSVWTNDSLSVQLGWFKKIKSSLCASEQGFFN